MLRRVCLPRISGLRHLSTSAGDTSPGLRGVRSIIAVASCKGGVGKSTVSVNLAYALQRRGLRVGLLDLDVHGPSLPTLLAPLDLRVRASKENKGFVHPLDCEGLRCMSFGWVNANAGVSGAGGSGAAILRGGQVSRVVTQLLCATEWGELDYLLLDTPPGTGDALITLCQTASLDGAVVVTTPSRLAYVDVAKGLEMFRSLRVPPLMVVENMSYFDCPGGSRHFLFGSGSGDRVASDAGLPAPLKIPVTEASSKANDLSMPVALLEPEGPEAKAYGAAAALLDERASRQRERAAEVRREEQERQGGDGAAEPAGSSAGAAPILVVKGQTSLRVRVFSDTSAEQLEVGYAALRAADPATGQPRPGAAEDGVEAILAVPMGNYAVRVDWSDGKRGDIYPIDVLRTVAEAEAEAR